METCIFAITYLHGVTESSVICNNYTTEWVQILQGVHFGDSLPSTLFSMYVNDLEIGIKKTFTK